MPGSHVLITAKRIAEDHLLANNAGLSCPRCTSHPQYLLRWLDNLVEGVIPADFEADLRTGDGSELKDRYSRRTGKPIPAKFCAPYSSAALAVNTFGPFRHRVPLPSVAGLAGFTIVRFEHRCDNGLRTRHCPNFDLLLQADDAAVVAVESKFLETLEKKRLISSRSTTAPSVVLMDGRS